MYELLPLIRVFLPLIELEREDRVGKVRGEQIRSQVCGRAAGKPSVVECKSGGAV